MDQQPQSTGSNSSTREGILLLSGLQLFLVRPKDYPEEGPRYRRLCMGLLWLHGILGHITLALTMVPAWIRYFGMGDAAAWPSAIASLGALGLFWGGVGAAMALFRLRGPRGKQWEQFYADVVVWAPWPGVVTFAALYGLLALAMNLT